ncbi:class I adenylate-forming enzyme family protein [Aneurinibacillus terranovensis]|uniref:class I adenylate-forming enzyme family protein n=1 Tax=Aneurinibacillus terranovensis TaxID=278991 RepID=UPI000425099C|nr:class I adenylate-forming enzyme family protein [Aneurinibacillus terranovensis]
MSHVITDGLFENARAYPEKTALCTSQVALTYQELAGQVAARAIYLREVAGCNKGDIIMLAMNNSHLFVEWFLAICEVGAIAAPVNPLQSAAEWGILVQQIQPMLVIADEHNKPHLMSLHTANILEAGVSIKTDVSSYQRTILDGGNLFYLALSSGTTGGPKGILRTHDSWIDSFHAMSIEFGIDSSDVMLLPGPLYYSATLICLLHLLYIGGTVKLTERFDAKETLRQMDGTTCCFMVPTMYRSVINEMEQVGRQGKGRAVTKADGAMRTFITAGAKMDISLKEKVTRFFPTSTLYEYYGAAEIGFVSVQIGIGSGNAVGRVFHGVEIDIRDEKGASLPRGQTGEIYVKSNMMAAGYYGEIPLDGFYPSGSSTNIWKSAGDVGLLDDDGVLHLSGRKKEMIISGGINIFPTEIENTLKQWLYTKDAGVVGIPDSYWGERVAAALVLSETPPGWEDALQDYLRERLTPHKIPKDFYLYAELPVNQAGKPDKAKLRSEITEKSQG